MLFSTWNPADFPSQGCFLECSISHIKDSQNKGWKLTFFFSLQNSKLSLGGCKTSVFTTQNTSGSKKAEMVFSKFKGDQNQDKQTWKRVSYSEIGVVGIAWNLTMTLTLERLQKWIFFFPASLCMNYFLGPNKQQQLHDEITLTTICSKRKAKKPNLPEILCICTEIHPPSVGVLTQSSDYHEHPTSYLVKTPPCKSKASCKNSHSDNNNANNEIFLNCEQMLILL